MRANEYGKYSQRGGNTCIPVGCQEQFSRNFSNVSVMPCSADIQHKFGNVIAHIILTNLYIIITERYIQAQLIGNKNSRKLYSSIFIRWVKSSYRYSKINCRGLCPKYLKKISQTRKFIVCW